MRSLITLMLIGSPLWAAEPKFTTAEPKERAPDLLQPGPADKDYPLPQDEAKAKKLRAETIAWYRAQFVDPFVNGPKANEKWAPKAKAALEAAAQYHSLYILSHRREMHWEKWCSALAAAVKAGCDDPVIKYYHVKNYQMIEKPADQAVEYAKWLTAMEQAKTPPLIRSYAALEIAYALYRDSKGTDQPKGNVKKAYLQMGRCLAELAKDRSGTAQAEVIELAYPLLQNYQTGGWGRESGYLDLAELLTDAGAPPALLNNVKGHFLVNFAWDARGNGSGSSVTEDGYAKFKARLGEAQTALEASWAADETQHLAAAEMIPVCMGLGLDREVMEKWFTRAMTANPDCYKACSAKSLYLDPKWGGSDEDKMAFGRQCFRTKNYHANLPYTLVFAQRSHVRGSHKVFADYCGEHPTAWADVREYYELALQVYPKDRLLRTEFATWCTGVGEWAAAKQHLAAIGNQPANDFFSDDSFKKFRKMIDDNLKDAKKAP